MTNEKEELTTISVNKSVWTKLTKLKLEGRHESLGDVIYSLLLKAKKISEEGK